MKDSDLEALAAQREINRLLPVIRDLKIALEASTGAIEHQIDSGWLEPAFGIALVKLSKKALAKAKRVGA